MLHLDLAHARESTPRARREVHEFVLSVWPHAATQSPLDDLLDDLRLVVSELVTNAVQHGAPPVTLDVTADLVQGRHRVTVTCHDCGPWDGSSPSPYGGRGLSLVRSVSTTVDIHGGLTSTTVIAALER